MTSGRVSVWDRITKAWWPESGRAELKSWGVAPDAHSAEFSGAIWRRFGKEVRTHPLSIAAKIAVYLTLRLLLVLCPLAIFVYLAALGSFAWLWVGSGLLALVGVPVAAWSVNVRDTSSARNLRAIRRARCGFLAHRSATDRAPGTSGFELIARRRYWSLQARRASFSFGAATAGVALLSAPMVAIQMPAAQSDWELAACVLSLCGYGLLVWYGLKSELKARRISRSLHRVACPSCGYDLLPPGGLGDGSAGVFIGPSRCPECGDRWPLVPPPVPASERLRLQETT